jgi:2',3'-cyclic-nucleotide 2'-phosphodiesterase/3'-nucleotidase
MGTKGIDSMIHLLCTSDIHGNLLNYDVALNQSKPYGLSSLPTLLNTFDQSKTILIDNGDVLQGSAFATYLNTHPKAKHSIALAMNACQVKYFNLGNHDFNYGLDVLFSFLKELDAPCITGNVLHHGQPLGHSVIHSIDNQKIGFIGAVTDYIPHWEKPEHIHGITFIDVLTYVQSEVERIRPLVDHLVVVYHGGFERDINTGLPTERLTGENVGYALSEIKGIDVLFTGHQHRSIAQIKDNIALLQCGFEGIEVMHASLHGKTWTPSLIDLSKYPKTEDIKDLYQEDIQPFETWLDTPCGALDEDRYQLVDDLKDRLVKPAIISLFNQIMIQETGADCASSSLFNVLVGLPQYPTMKDLLAAYPYPNIIVVKKLDKETLLGYLEQNASFFSLDSDGKIVISPSFVYPKKQLYNYDMIDGIEYTMDISKPVGQRITHCTFKGLPLNDDTILRCAMNNYRSVGGGDFTMIAEAPLDYDTGKDMMTLLVNALTDKHVIQVNHTNNITIIAGEQK